MGALVRRPSSVVRNPWSRAKRESGFALLITITLLAFLVVLLIGLATYTRVETAVAGNTQRQAQARENALLALNLAVAHLQKYAGPDQRVTATAESFGGINGTRHYTGVWDSSPGASGATPLTWLVSGNELPAADGTAGNALAVMPGAPGSSTVPLVGSQSLGTTSATDTVSAPLQDIKTVGVPGTPAVAATTIGRYAWWIGDQGVKAPVALGDPTAAVNYAPWDSAELNSRIRQQIALGAGAFDPTINAPVFEPRDSNNSPLVANGKVSAFNQLAFLKNSNGGALGLATVQKNFHVWSPNNYAVLANTKLGGLRQDLSLDPTLLGSAFAAWVDYPGYTEDPATGTAGAPAISPAYGSDPLRRRYALTPHVLDGSGSHQVGPVPTYFLISFNVRTKNNSTAANAPLEVRARWMVSLWNPYSAALVPEDLQIEVSGLPGSVRIVNDNPARSSSFVGSFSLASSATFGSPLVASLPWPSAAIPPGVPIEDRRSWLPGRVYTWRSAENTTDSTPPSGGYVTDFYSRTLDDGGQGVTRTLSGITVADGGDTCHLDVNGSAGLTITIYAVRASGRVRLSGCVSPDFVTSFSTTPQAASASGYQFSYVFRLAESLDTPNAPGTWLTTEGRDVRRRTLPAECFVVAENGNDPSQYGNSYKKISSPDRLLDRATDEYDYNQDVPLFELPRAPLLSVGELQHFRLVNHRPFMIGNSWGVAETLNGIPVGELFDRFFFSGLLSSVNPVTTSAGDLGLPNPLLKPLRSADGGKPTAGDLRNASESRTGKFLLQGGAFNLNSTNIAAWAAVLRGVRWPAQPSSVYLGGAFGYLDASSQTGTGVDSPQLTVQSTDAQFFRFAQSAQETYKAEPGNSGGAAHTELFRRGMTTLTAARIFALANSIKNLIVERQAGSGRYSGAALLGPFRSLGEFLSAPLNSSGAALLTDADGKPQSLLERAIADAGINASVTEFSSQFLTQGDIMTALAPVLFPRSDTFVVRAYGEVLNPITSTPAAPVIEGRAWCEAIVQRVPEYFNAGADDAAASPPTDPLNRNYGRRFKVVSFRWLTRSDI